MYVSETCLVMISSSGESLIVPASENGIPLPFMTDIMLLIGLLLAYG